MWLTYMQCKAVCNDDLNRWLGTMCFPKRDGARLVDSWGEGHMNTFLPWVTWVHILFETKLCQSFPKPDYLGLVRNKDWAFEYKGRAPSGWDVMKEGDTKGDPACLDMMKESHDKSFVWTGIIAGHLLQNKRQIWRWLSIQAHKLLFSKYSNYLWSFCEDWFKELFCLVLNVLTRVTIFSAVSWWLKLHIALQK